MKKPIIICVDDEKIILDSLKAQLKEFLKQDYHIEMAESGEEALEIIDGLIEEEKTPNLVIADMIMPKMNGDELLAKIHQKCPDTLSILLTGQAEKGDIIKTINAAGLYRYMTKPWNKSDLIQNIKDAIEYSNDHSTNRDLVTINKQLISKLVKRSETIGGQNRELQQRESEILSQKKSMEEQNKKLMELNNVKNKLFSVVSHDLKGPVHTLKSALELLENEFITPEEFQKISKQLTVQLKNNSRLLDDLLHWAISQLEGFNPSPKFINLKPLIEETIALFKSNADQKEIFLESRVEKELMAYADKDMISIVIRNLIANAIKYTTKNDSIIVKASRDKEKITVFVKDTGIGISDSQKSKLFGTLGHSLNGTNNEHGTGFGLMLCRDLLEKNAGHIGVESDENSGTTFFFTLPATESIKILEP